MKLALIGHGGMGRMVESLARADGHEIATIISSGAAAHSPEELASMLRGHDAAIDFSVSGAVLKNIKACAQAHVPLVEGATGWQAEEDEARRIVAEYDGALIYGANFSIGVNLFYRIVENAANLFGRVEGYEPFIEEAHHSRKRDAPSGTALRLQRLLKQHLPAPAEVAIASTRAGHIPGTHCVGFDSAADQITLTHTARSREGFARGALTAANWIKGRRGFYQFSEVIDQILNERTRPT
jgi:4-hydroxy-tetrahydrodipicolinate reductase